MVMNRYTSDPGRDATCDDLAARIAKRGIIINLIAPLGLVALAYAIREAGIGVDPANRLELFPILFYAFFAVSVSELIAAFILRRQLFTAQRLGVDTATGRFDANKALQAATIVLAIGATPIVYGIALYLLGGAITDVVWFALMNLLAFRLLRPDAEYLSRIARPETAA